MKFDGPVAGIPGAFIRHVDSLPDHLPDAEPAGQSSQAKPGELLIDLPNVARFLIREGTSIEVAVAPDADPGMVLLLLNGSARGGLIHQRGELALHAATLVPPGRDGAIALCADSGVGKSTLAYELTRRGWELVADDTTRVTWNGTNAIGWPSRDFIKLWRDACEANGIDVADLDRVTAKMDKYYLRVPARSEPVRLSCVIELSVAHPARQGCSSLAERMSLLTRHTYRRAFVRPLGRQADFVQMVAHAASTCKIAQLTDVRSRPVAALADIVEELAQDLPAL